MSQVRWLRIPLNACPARLQDNRIWFGPNGDSVPCIKRFLTELKYDGMAPTSIMFYKEVGHSQEGAKELVSLFDGKGYFDGPKPTKLLQRLITLANLLMCDKEAIEVQKILPFLSDTWPLCRIGRAVIRASQSCRQSCNISQCPACGCRSHHSCTHAPQFSRSFPAREWGSVLQRQGACGQCP